MFCPRSQKIKNDKQQKIKPVGLFGGTFNPIHTGHVEIARQACRQFGLEKVIVMPSGRPPHKTGMKIAGDAARCDMVRLAIEDYPELEFSDYEVLKEGYSFSSETLIEFSKLYEDIYFIIGADSLFQIESWHCPETIMRLAAIAVAGRGGYPPDELGRCADHLADRYGADVRFLHMPDMPVSSSKIRERIRNGCTVEGMLDPKVEDYICRNGLYGD